MILDYLEDYSKDSIETYELCISFYSLSLSFFVSASKWFLSYELIDPALK